jgi:uncharacterized damage-inducible protein DinB
MLSLMTPETAKTLLDFLLPQLKQEFEVTRKVLAAVPENARDYKPSERCMPALELANHIAGSEAFFLTGVLKGGFAWNEGEFAKCKTVAEVLAFYDTLPAMVDEIAKLPAENLAQDVAFYKWSSPAVTFLQLHLKHAAHHRGQLSAYLRPMGAKVPSIYGPSADEGQEAAASS